MARSPALLMALCGKQRLQRRRHADLNTLDLTLSSMSYGQCVPSPTTGGPGWVERTLPRTLHRARPASSIPPTVTVLSFTDNRQCRLSMMTFVLASVLVLKQGER
jgi:hypothetical protein